MQFYVHINVPKNHCQSKITKGTIMDYARKLVGWYYTGLTVDHR